MNNTEHLALGHTKDELVRYLHNHEVVAYHFMKKILNINYYNAIVTQDSWLSDFEGGGLTDSDYIRIADEYDSRDKTNMTYEQTERLYKNLKFFYWNKVTCKKIIAEYGIDIKSTKIILYILLDNIISTSNLLKLEKETKKFVFDSVDENIDWIKFKEKLSNNNSKEKLTEQQVQETLETTLSPFFYAKYAGVTFVEAMEVVEERKKKQLGVYKPYRPVVESE